MDQDTELACKIYHAFMSVMKYTLNLEEQHYTESGKQDPRFLFFKQELMNKTYSTVEDLLKTLQDNKIINETDYKEHLRYGYKKTASGGSGYLNTDEFNDFLNNQGT